MTLVYPDHRADPAGWASALGTTVEAVELWLDAHVVDLHNDVEVPVRLFGYDPSVRHGPWRRAMPFFRHTDYPRLREAAFTGVCYDIATNVFRGERNRQATTLDNLRRARARIEAHPSELGVARTMAEYDAIVADGRTAFFLTLQGGNALAHDPSVLDGPVGDEITRITLVHLSTSVLGGSNSPSQPDTGLTARGRDFVARCNARHILVDLARASGPSGRPSTPTSTTCRPSSPTPASRGFVPTGATSPTRSAAPSPTVAAASGSSTRATSWRTSRWVSRARAPRSSTTSSTSSTSRAKTPRRSAPTTTA